MGHLVDAAERAYRVLGLDDATGGDEVFRHLVLARIIEPTTNRTACGYLRKQASARCRIPRSTGGCLFTRGKSGGSGCRLPAPRMPGSASLVLYDVPTLYFETDTGDGFREPGFSKERRRGGSHPEPPRREDQALPGQVEL